MRQKGDEKHSYRQDNQSATITQYHWPIFNILKALERGFQSTSHDHIDPVYVAFLFFSMLRQTWKLLETLEDSEIDVAITLQICVYSHHKRSITCR